MQGGKQQDGKEVRNPDDMLIKNGKPVRSVFLLGKAAHGKTTYCKWLLKTWCNTQQPCVSGTHLSKWENALSQFDFVFHIPLRYVDPSRANVTDMICQDFMGSDTDLQAAARHVLSCDKYRCFIIMDGLEEWKPDQSVKDRLKYKGMPNIDNVSNYVIFTGMRPWKFSEVHGVKNEDRVIEIQGLDNDGIESVVEKVLSHYYKIKPGTFEYKTKYGNIIRKLEDKTVKSFIKIPLLAVVCIQIWYEGEEVGDNMTSFYIAMVDMLIQRAHRKYDTQKLIFEAININDTLPNQMLTTKNIRNYFDVLLNLGKVAYEGLLSEMKLVFQKDDLEKEIGERELEFVIDVGLISQRDVHSVMKEKVSVHFFHKSVQEFLAAIYIVTNKEVSDSFCAHLCDIKVIKELSNVIMFICGISPFLGSVISQRVVSVTDSDADICKYREIPYLGISAVDELYKLQVSWYRELKYGKTDSQIKDSPVTCHVSDVYLSNSDMETVRVTRELLSDNLEDIRSFYLEYISTEEDDGITNTVINDFLCNTQDIRSLTKVFIDGCETNTRSINMIRLPTLRSLSLSYITVQESNTMRDPVLSHCDMLQLLYLEGVRLNDRDLGLISRMTMLQKVELADVHMTESWWGRWLKSVIKIHHQFLVRLRDTNIDEHTMSTIHSSKHLSVKHDDDAVDGDDLFEFIRVWPMTEDTSCCILL